MRHGKSKRLLKLYSESVFLQSESVFLQYGSSEREGIKRKLFKKTDCHYLVYLPVSLTNHPVSCPLRACCRTAPPDIFQDSLRRLSSSSLIFQIYSWFFVLRIKLGKWLRREQFFNYNFYIRPIRFAFEFFHHRPD
ncbi:MAG: hypothetical protein UX94_C0001G0031 [Parcubacteria group bacterium GW2011_GWA2_47_21]|nr:MAG: hypothetical protein UX94_C0001G0031 [Parcubacteria group bacterium GW2011_GWA2_47_21]